MMQFGFSASPGRGASFSLRRASARLKPTLILLIIPALLSAADAKKEKARLPAELEQVFGLAMAAPPEFAADALLRIAGRTEDRDLRRDLIDLAFHAAAGAHNPFALETLPGAEADTVSQSVAAASRLGLDKLTLQTRAVRDLLPIDQERARQLFGELQKPAIPVAGCETALLPNVTPYYETLGDIIKSGFSKELIAKSEHVSYLVSALSRVSSVRELASAARLVAALDWPKNTFEIAFGAFTSRLSAMPTDSRTFMASANGIDEAIAQLTARARKMGVNTQGLVGAYRGFLVMEFKAARCADSIMPTGRMVDGEQRREIFAEDIRGDVAPLSFEEKTVESSDGYVAVERFWQSEPAQKVFQEATKLRQGPNGTNYTEAERRSREWTRQFSDVLNAVAGWKVSDESSEALYFHQKATVYEALLELTPSGDSMDRLTASFLGFMKGSNLQQTHPVEWFWHARAAFDRVRADRPDQAARIAAAYRESGILILVLEAALDAAAPRSAFR